MDTGEATDIDLVCRLLRHTFDRLTDSHNGGIEVQFEEVYSNSLIKFAGRQQVLWAMVYDGGQNDGSPSIASHLRDNIEEMARKRSVQLLEVHRALGDVCPVLLLKGACLIAESDFNPVPWRSMADIDFLIPRQKLDEVLKVLLALGYDAGGEIYTEALHAHYPMLYKEGFEAGIEVHTRCFRWPLDELLHPELMRERARKVETEHGPVLLPEINDRIIHLIAHGQIASNGYARREFLMRDALEFQILLSREGADLQEVCRVFEGAGYKGHFWTFIHMADRVMGTRSIEPAFRSPKHHQWVEDAWTGIQSPETLNKFRRADVFKSIFVNAATPGRWGAIGQAILNPDEFKDLVRRVGRILFR